MTLKNITEYGATPGTNFDTAWALAMADTDLRALQITDAFTSEGVIVPSTATVTLIDFVGGHVELESSMDAVLFDVQKAQYLEIRNPSVSSDGGKTDGNNTKFITYPAGSSYHHITGIITVNNFSGTPHIIEHNACVFHTIGIIQGNNAGGVAFKKATVGGNLVQCTAVSIAGGYMSGMKNAIYGNDIVNGHFGRAHPLVMEYGGDISTEHGALHMEGGQDIHFGNIYFEQNYRNAVLKNGDFYFDKMTKFVGTAKDVIQNANMATYEKTETNFTFLGIADNNVWHTIYTIPSGEMTGIPQQLASYEFEVYMGRSDLKYGIASGKIRNNAMTIDTHTEWGGQANTAAWLRLSGNDIQLFRNYSAHTYSRDYKLYLKRIKLNEEPWG